MSIPAPTTEAQFQQSFIQRKLELSELRVPEVKSVLAALHLLRSGNKPELIARVTNYIEDCHRQGNTAARDQACNTIQEVHAKYRGFGMPARYGGNTGAGVGGFATAGASSGSSASNATALFPQVGKFTLTIPRANIASQLKPEKVQNNPQASNSLGGYGMSGSSSSSSGSGLVKGYTDTTKRMSCICMSQTVQGRGMDEACSICGVLFHTQCYQLPGGAVKGNQSTNKPTCFLCVSKFQDPVIQVEETILGPTRLLANHSGNVNLKYKLTNAQQIAIIKSGEGTVNRTRPGALRLLLRCYPVTPSEKEKKVGARYPVHSWPLETTLRINGDQLMVKQRQVYYHADVRKHKGNSEPVDIFPPSRTGVNQLVMTYRDYTPYVVVLQIIKNIGVDQLFQQVLRSPSTPTIEQSLERVKSSFNVCSIDSDEENDEPMAMVTRLSLRCPLGLCPIDTPARGKNCAHLQCFDLSTFLRFNEKASASAWKCGVCHNPLCIDELQVDSFMLDIIQKLKESKSHGHEDLDSIEIDATGAWKLYSSSAQNSRKRKAPDTESNIDDQPDEKMPYIPSLAEASSSGASSSMARTSYAEPLTVESPVRGGPPQAAASSSSASHFIDLTLSDDEDEAGGEEQGGVGGGGGMYSGKGKGRGMVQELIVDSDEEGGGGGGGGDGGGGIRWLSPSRPSTTVTSLAPSGTMAPVSSSSSSQQQQDGSSGVDVPRFNGGSLASIFDRPFPAELDQSPSQRQTQQSQPQPPPPPASFPPQQHQPPLLVSMAQPTSLFEVTAPSFPAPPASGGGIMYMSMTAPQPPPALFSGAPPFLTGLGVGVGALMTMAPMTTLASSSSATTPLILPTMATTVSQPMALGTGPPPPPPPTIMADDGSTSVFFEDGGSFGQEDISGGGGEGDGDEDDDDQQSFSFLDDL